MFADAVAALAASIFPIFYAYERDDGPILSVVGTGFFVDDNGLFVTGDHLMNCAPAGAEYYYFGNLPDELIQPPLRASFADWMGGPSFRGGLVSRNPVIFTLA